MYKHFEKLIFLSFFCGLMSACGPVEESHASAEATCEAPLTAPHPRAAALQRALDEATAGIVPGAIWYVADARGSWVGATGYADMAREIPMQPCTPHRIASVTKSFVAVTTLRLAQRGELSLDDPIARWLTPERAAQFEASDQVTVRQLLQHSSGYANFTLPISIALFNDPERTWSTDYALTLAASDRRLFDTPGARHEYANTNYLLLAEVIEGVTGRSHQEVLREEVFAPAALSHTSYAPDEVRFDDTLDRGYMELQKTGEFIDVSDTYANNVIGADGGIVSTAEDVGRFLRAALVGEGLLDEAPRDALRAWLPSESDWGFEGYGLGFARWVTPHGEGMGHTGQEFGYLTFAYHFPERDVTFVFMTNASAISVPLAHNVTYRVMATILPALLEAALAP